MPDRRLNRRDFLRLAGVTAAATAVAACQPAAPSVVEVEKPVVVEKEVVKEVEVEKVVEKEVQVVVTPTRSAAADEKPVIRWQFAGGGVYQEAASKGADRFNEDQDDILLLIEPRPPDTFEKLMAAMVALRRKSLRAPVHIGDVVVRGVAGTSVDVIATKNIRKKRFRKNR